MGEIQQNHAMVHVIGFTPKFSCYQTTILVGSKLPMTIAKIYITKATGGYDIILLLYLTIIFAGDIDNIRRRHPFIPTLVVVTRDSVGLLLGGLFP